MPSEHQEQGVPERLADPVRCLEVANAAECSLHEGLKDLSAKIGRCFGVGCGEERLWHVCWHDGITQRSAAAADSCADKVIPDVIPANTVHSGDDSNEAYCTGMVQKNVVRRNVHTTKEGINLEGGNSQP